jgi:hypothetical protein
MNRRSLAFSNVRLRIFTARPDFLLDRCQVGLYSSRRFSIKHGLEKICRDIYDDHLAHRVHPFFDLTKFVPMSYRLTGHTFPATDRNATTYASFVHND